MVAFDFTVSLGDLLILAFLAGSLVLGAARLRQGRVLAHRARETQQHLRALIERVEALALVQPGASPLTLATDPDATGCLRDDSEVLDEGLVSKLAAAVSILVQHTDLTQGGDKDPGVELLEAVRQSCLAVIETVWLRDLNNAYDASRRRRETLFKRCASVADLRLRIRAEDAHLRADMERLSARLEDMVLATEGRYAKASVRLTAALRRILG